MPVANPPDLIVDFAGEIYSLSPDSVFTIGRLGDLVIDDNPYLHRRFLEIYHAEAMWWVTNVGSRASARLSDAAGLTQSVLAPGARFPLAFPRCFLGFSAGRITYELELIQPGAADRPLQQGKAPEGDTTIGPSDFTESQLLAILALAEPVLRRGTGAWSVRSAVDAARRLGWTQTRFNRKLDNVCDKLDRAGVRGLRGDSASQAASRRVRLVEYAVNSLVVTTGDLALLEAESALNARAAQSQSGQRRADA